MRFVLKMVKIAAFLMPLFFLASCYSPSQDHTYEEMVELDFAADFTPKECRYIVLHTSDNRAPTKITKKTGKAYFTKVAQERGFPSQSYHFILYEDGQIDTLIPLNNNSRIDYWEKACGVAGYNSISVHIVYVGGRNFLGRCTDTRTEGQKYSTLVVVAKLKSIFRNANVVGHNDLNRGKGCPCYNVVDWFKSLKIDPI